MELIQNIQCKDLLMKCPVHGSQKLRIKEGDNVIEIFCGKCNNAFLGRISASYRCAARQDFCNLTMHLIIKHRKLLMSLTTHGDEMVGKN